MTPQEVNQRPNTDDFVAFLRDIADPHVRSVVTYTDDAFTVEYIRKDLTAQYTQSEVETLIETFRNDERTETRRETSLNAGEHHTTVRLYDESIIIHFPQDSTHRTLVAFDPTVAPRLTNFIYQSLTYLYDDSSKKMPTNPDW